jgi:uncharacterized membrane protein
MTVIAHPAHDSCVAFLEMKGFSPRNLKYRRTFTQNWSGSRIVQEVLAQLLFSKNKFSQCDKIKSIFQKDID